MDTVLCSVKDSIGMRGAPAVLVFDDSEESRSMCHQSFAKDADINNIMKKYEVTGVLVDPRFVNENRAPRFGDYSDIPDFAVIQQRVIDARADFMTLPADVRARFQNDVGEALEFVADPANLEEAVKLHMIPDTNPAYVQLMAERTKVKEGAPQAPAA